MLVTFLLWIYFAFLLVTYGAMAAAFIQRCLQVRMEAPVSSSVLAVLGLLVVAWLSSALSLVLRMGLFIHLCILVGAFVIYYFRYREIKALLSTEFSRNHWSVWVTFLLGCLTILLYAVKAPANPDTPLYHAQAIHWIEEYPAVPGLGNLDPRLGANSNWLVVNAFFSLSFLGGQSFHLIPSFLFLICFLYFLGGLQQILEGNLSLSQFAKTGFIPFAFYILIDEVSSPGTDLPVILLYWFLICLWLESTEQTTSQRLLQTVVFTLAVSVVTFKISGMMILLFSLWIWIDRLRRKEYRTLWFYTGIASAILLPWLVRTFILTGYWLYPEPLMAVLSPDLDWMIPPERVLSFKRGIQAWALSPRADWEEVAGRSLMARLGFWFANLTLNRKTILILALCTPLLAAVFFLAGRRNQKQKSCSPVVLLSYLNLLFWLFMAPNFRFGYGFVVGAIVPACSIPVLSISERLRLPRYSIALVLALALSVQQVYIIHGSGRDDMHFADHLLFPAAYPHVPTAPCKVGEAVILCAQNWRQCGYDAFPCAPQPPKNVEMRGESLRDGFRRIPPPE